MIVSYIPKFLLTEEDIIVLKDKGIHFQEGKQKVGNYKVHCYKFFNLNESQVFDEIESHALLESTNNDSEKISYANRVLSIIYLRIREMTMMKDKNQKMIAACSLLAAVNSLALMNISYAKRFIPLLRSI